MVEHPPSYLLEELAAGAGDDQTARHVRECEVCQAYMNRLEKAAAEYARQAPSPEQFADQVAIIRRYPLHPEGRSVRRRPLRRLGHRRIPGSGGSSKTEPSIRGSHSDSPARRERAMTPPRRCGTALAVLLGLAALVSRSSCSMRADPPAPKA